MIKSLSQLKNIPLSDSDVMELVEGRAKVLLYSELANYETLEDALGDHQAIFLLYESKPNYGHWTAVLRLVDDDGFSDTIEFFDPYGEFPDEMLDNISKNFRMKSGQEFPQLSYLMYHSPFKLTYNNFPFQELAAGINTCGRWSALRIVFRQFPLKQFKKLFLEGGDNVVAQLTSPDLFY